MTKQFLDDQNLIALYSGGDEEALEILVHRHKSRIFSYLVMMLKNKSLAEDLFQDTFIKVIRTVKKGAYNEEGKFLPWVLRIAHNLVIDHFRKEKRMPKLRGGESSEGEEYDIFDLIPYEDSNLEDKVITCQKRKDLRKLINQLPLEQKEVLMMRHYYDMSFKEIATRTNVSINTALGRMRYALINMRKLVEESEALVA